MDTRNNEYSVLVGKGFTSATTPWLPVNNNDPTVDLQKSRTNSIWWAVRDFVEIKKSSVTLTNGTIDFPTVSADIFSFTRYFSFYISDVH